MPVLFVYLLKVNIVLTLFYLVYRLILRPLTFYKVNRCFLISGIVLSTLYPVLNLQAFFRENPAIGSRVVVLVPDWKIYDRVLVSVDKPDPSAILYLVAEILFWSGVALLVLRFLVQLASVYRLHRRSAPATWKEYRFRNVKEEVSPFSFLRNIYLNTDKVKHSDLETVLSHEKVHADGLHTADVLLSELATIFYWFNPGAWLTRRAIKENLEFITDQKILNAGTDSKSYQYSLLRMTVSQDASPIVNHFNLLTLKNRIVMMNKKRSSSIHFAKYLVMVPVVLVLAFIVTASKAQFETTGKSVVRMLHDARLTLGNTLSDRPSESSITGVTGSQDTVYMPASNLQDLAAEADTGKQITPLIIRGSSGDSVNVMIDGKPAKDLNSLNPDEIADITVLGSASALAIFGADSEYAKGVVVVRTKKFKNSPEAKKLAEKIGVYSVQWPITVTNTFGNAIIAPSNATVLSLSADTTLLARGSNFTVVKPTTASGVGTSGTIDGPVLIAKSGRVSGVGSQNPLTEVTVTGYSARKVVGGVALTTPVSNSAKPSIFGNALILIDGREASFDEIEHLDAMNIKAIDILKTEKLIAPYGEKGKNGVVKITTKN